MSGYKSDICIYMNVESKENLKVLPMFVTLDPQRDNPPHLRAYLEG
jgi:cytochrome oxidase Cu insertion factor (SCO1/SenC/PrrC family)